MQQEYDIEVGNGGACVWESLLHRLRGDITVVCLDTMSITVKEILKMTAVKEHFNHAARRKVAQPVVLHT